MENQTQPPEPDEMTVARAAKLTGVSERRIRELAASGRIASRTYPGPGDGEQLLVSVADIRACVDAAGDAGSPRTGVAPPSRLIPVAPAPPAESVPDNLQDIVRRLDSYLRDEFIGEMAHALHQLPTRSELDDRLSRVEQLLEGLRAEVALLRDEVQVRQQGDQS